MSELAQRGDLPVATVKYYLREGLLHPGEAVGATRARYDESHVRRLRLVRALTDVARLSLEQVRTVLEAVGDDRRSRHDTLAAAHARLPLPGGTTTDPDPEARQRVTALLARHGWSLPEDDPYVLALVSSLSAMATLGRLPGDDQLDAYADAAARVARADVATTEVPDDADAVERAVLGTLLLEPVLLSLRRIAQRQVSARG